MKDLDAAIRPRRDRCDGWKVGVEVLHWRGLRRPSAQDDRVRERARPAAPVLRRLSPGPVPIFGSATQAIRHAGHMLTATGRQREGMVYSFVQPVVTARRPVAERTGVTALVASRVATWVRASARRLVRTGRLARAAHR